MYREKPPYWQLPDKSHSPFAYIKAISMWTFVTSDIYEPLHAQNYALTSTNDSLLP